MSERETWLPFSKSLNQYDPDVTSWRMGHLSEIESECNILNLDKWKGATDWRPVRIPPPAEIEANARDAARYRWLRNDAWEGVAEVPVVFECELGRVPIDGDDLDTAIDAAMEGGE